MANVLQVLAHHQAAMKEIELAIQQKRDFFVAYLEKYREEIVSRLPRSATTELFFPYPLAKTGDVEIKFVYQSCSGGEGSDSVQIIWSAISPNFVRIIGSKGSERLKHVSLFRDSSVDITEFVAEVLKDDLSLLRRNMPFVSPKTEA